MDLYEAIKMRCSVRKFRDLAVDDEKLSRILEAGRLAPTARNRQEFKIVVVRDADVIKRLGEAAEQKWLEGAPVVLAAVGLTPQEKMHCQIPTDPVDCAIVIDHITLAAVAEGLGSCWVGHFDQDACRRILGVPDSARVAVLVGMGYPAGKPAAARKRKSLQQIVCHEKFT